jgi:hypothetical protein
MHRYRVTSWERTARITTVVAESEEDAMDLADEAPDEDTYTEGDGQEVEDLGPVDDDDEV